jgi:hypothetical protein
MSGAVGSYLRGVPNAADTDEFNVDLRRAHDGLGPVTPRATAAQIKQVFEEAQLADETRANNIAASNEFVALHPEFIDHPKNGAQFNATLNAMFGEGLAYTLDQFERAYAVCRANNSLALNQEVLAKQADADAKERAKAARAKRAAETRVYSEAEKESMSLEELRTLEDHEIQKRNEKISQEGGWY